MKQCKKKNITPTFENVTLVIRHRTYKLKKKIAHTVIVADLQNKGHKRERLEKDIIQEASKLTSSVSIIMYSALLHEINIAVKSKSRAITLK